MPSLEPPSAFLARPPRFNAPTCLMPSRCSLARLSSRLMKLSITVGFSTRPPDLRAMRSWRTFAALPTTLPPDLKARLLIGRIPVLAPSLSNGSGVQDDESTFCDVAVVMSLAFFAAPERAAFRYSCIDLLLILRHGSYSLERIL